MYRQTHKDPAIGTDVPVSIQVHVHFYAHFLHCEGVPCGLSLCQASHLYSECAQLFFHIADILKNKISRRSHISSRLYPEPLKGRCYIIGFFPFYATAVSHHISHVF
jgi:hypothetical protein